MDEQIVLNRELLKAIGADSRIAILKSLRERRKTQSELAQELGLTAPTVLEHVQHLESAGLVEKMDEGRKWKYYRLTAKAQRLLSGSRVHAVVVLAVAVVAVLVGLVLWTQAMAPAAVSQDLEPSALETSSALVATAGEEQGAPLEAWAPAEALDLPENETNATTNETR